MKDSKIFGGEFAGERDCARLSRQIERIRAWALARDWFTLRDASASLEKLYGIPFPEGSLSAQLRNLEKRAAGKLHCKKEIRRRTGSSAWEYRLHAAPEIAPADAGLTPPLAKIKWPATFEQLEAAGYGYTGQGKQCSCGARFLWFVRPNGQWIALFALADMRLMPHAAVCKNNAHRARASPNPSSASAQASLFAEG